MNWLDKIVPSRISPPPETERKHSVPEGVWCKCDNCETALYRPELVRNLEVCPNCGHHHYLSARSRLENFLDAQGRMEIAAHLRASDPLKFQDTKKYTERLIEHQKNTGELEAMIVMQGRLRGLGVVACAFEPKFIGGSMGSVVGEKFVRGVQASIDQSLPFVCFANSGGARMQEGLYSLMQMAKTSAALAKLAEQQLPFISVLTNPTTGGVSASLAMLGDILIAEPQALIGFAGPRVIKDTVGQTLPDGFQRSEFLLPKGAIDLIIDRRHLNERIYKILSLLLHR